jgi:putative peptidoglycan lipid II flippase
MSMALTVPSAVALMVIPGALVSVLFGRGAFTPDDVDATALAVAVYGAGLPAFVLQKVLQPLYFAREDTRTPFRFALVAMVVNAVVAVGMAWAIGYIGAAIGTTVAAWAMVWLLWRGTRPMGDVARFDDRFRTRLPRIVAASALMGAAVLGLAYILAPFLIIGGLRWIALLILILVGMVVYFGGGHVIGAFRLGEFRRALRR